MAEETYRNDAPECPYCGYVHRHDGGEFYNEDLTEYDCESCDRTFDVSVHTSTSWTCSPRDDQP
jgi:transposase-like protein